MRNQAVRSSIRRGSTRGRAPRTIAIACAIAFATGCAQVGDQPEIQPYRYAPASAARPWSPTAPSNYLTPPLRQSAPFANGAATAPTAAPAETVPAPVATSDADEDPAATAPSAANDPASATSPSAPRYDLAALIDLGLANNPDTHRAWEAARAAAARYGAARAPYYPLVTSEFDAGYQRTPFPFPGQIVALKQWQADPTIALTYALMDFGRRRANADAARDALAAANFRFNRELQRVVFAIERGYFALAASRAAVTAATRNLELSEADLRAVKQRRDLGLATQPEYLLAKEREAQSKYDLANARLMVAEARADLAVALGIPADEPFAVEPLDRMAAPRALGAELEALIGEAKRMRPDLAARVAEMRQREAIRREAAAQWRPEIDLESAYGQDVWGFQIAGPPTVNVNEPQYSAIVALRWDLFTGFRRRNDDRRAESEQAAARDALRSRQIDAIAEVWRAYYEFQSAREKYDYANALLAATREAYTANRETYRQGLSTIIELLTASRDLAGARYVHIQSHADLLTAAAAAAYAAGAIAPPTTP